MRTVVEAPLRETGLKTLGMAREIWIFGTPRLMGTERIYHAPLVVDMA